MDHDELFSLLKELGGGITFPGHFDANINEVSACLSDPERGSLAEYVKLVQIGISSRSEGCALSHDEIHLLSYLRYGILRWDFDEFYGDASDSIWRWMNSEKLRLERERTYERRREKASRHISKREVRTRIFERDGYRCLHCQTNENLSVDHITPVIHGGGNEDDNLQILCRSCNSSKGGKL